MGLINNINIKDNFWECYQQFKVTVPFDALYTKDTSKNKIQSSQILWAISMLIEVGDHNVYRNLSTEDKKPLIAEDYLKNKSFKWDDYKIYIEAYKRFAITPEERRLLQHDEKMQERDKFIASTIYSLDSASLLDNMEKNRVTMGKIRKELVELAKESSTSIVKVRGDKKLSLSEEGRI